MSPDLTLWYQAPTEEARSPRPVKSAFNLDARHNTYSDSTNLPHGFTPHFRERSIPACAGEPIGPRHEDLVRMTVYPRVCGCSVDLQTTPDSGRWWPHPSVVRAHRCGPPPPLPSGSVYPRVCGGTSQWSWGQSTACPLRPRMCGCSSRWMRSADLRGHEGLFPRVRGNQVSGVGWCGHSSPDGAKRYCSICIACRI